jgi:hypothetical protein
MAIWHFRSILIPEVILRRKYSTMPTKVAVEMIDFPWWSEVEAQQGLERWINSLLPPLEPWSDMRRWGYEHGHRVYLTYADQNLAKIEEISLCIDARCVSDELIDTYCRIASKLECVFLTRRGEILIPEKVSILRAVKTSVAGRFLEDPVATLRGLECPSISVSIDRRTDED